MAVAEVKRAGRVAYREASPEAQSGLPAVLIHGFPEPSRLQKQLALFAACSLADQIARTVEANLVLRVDWVESPHLGPGRLGMTICPGRQDRDRNLEADLARLRAEGVDRLLCLSTDAELDWAGVPELGSRARPSTSSGGVATGSSEASRSS